ncbi:MAG: allophanate hydrolase subunit 1 [Pseudomonadota bacterium]
MKQAYDVKFSGDDAVRIEGLSRAERDAIYAQLKAQRDWVEVVPARSSVTVQFDPLLTSPSEALEKINRDYDPVPVDAGDRLPPIEIPVVYGGGYGPDLNAVCEALELSAEELIALHTELVHRVDFLGFTPGFSYLYTDEDAGFDTPRLNRPRQKVAPGSIGVVGGATGIYALAGPGGWPVIGRTPMQLFDPSCSNPSRLVSGQRVTFQSISASEFDEHAK